MERREEGGTPQFDEPGALAHASRVKDLRVVAVAIGVAMLIIGAAAAARFSDWPRNGAAAVEHPNSPTVGTTQVRRMVEGVDYRFLYKNSDDSVIRWDPCRPIRYEVHVESSVSDGVEFFQEGMRRLADATGLKFEYVGTTDRVPTNRENRLGGWIDRPAWIGWAQSTDTDLLTDPERKHYWGGVGSMSEWVRLDRDHIAPTSGMVVLNADTGSRPGFGPGYARGNTLLHELGHLVGLDHVDDKGAVMFSESSDTKLDGFSPGDLEGLRRVGAEQGCLPQRSKTSGTTTTKTVPSTVAPTTVTSVPPASPVGVIPQGWITINGLAPDHHFVTAHFGEPDGAWTLSSPYPAERTGQDIYSFDVPGEAGVYFTSIHDAGTWPTPEDFYGDFHFATALGPDPFSRFDLGPFDAREYRSRPDESAKWVTIAIYATPTTGFVMSTRGNLNTTLSTTTLEMMARTFGYRLGSTQ